MNLRSLFQRQPPRHPAAVTRRVESARSHDAAVQHRIEELQKASACAATMGSLDKPMRSRAEVTADIRYARELRKLNQKYSSAGGSAENGAMGTQYHSRRKECGGHSPTLSTATTAPVKFPPVEHGKGA